METLVWHFHVTLRTCTAAIRVTERLGRSGDNREMHHTELTESGDSEVEHGGGIAAGVQDVILVLQHLPAAGSHRANTVISTVSIHVSCDTVIWRRNIRLWGETQEN